MPALFVSLGISPAIVPEAFLFPGVNFDEVHVLTTEKPDVTFVLEWFRQRAPAVRLTISRVEGFFDFTSEADHFRFEEVLYRWLLAASAPPAERYISLAGGFKTMSAAMQKAAAVFGAAEVFHVLCNLPPERQPRTADDIDAARQANHLQWIRLGPESGWPQFAATNPAAYPLISDRTTADARWLSSPDQRFREHLRAVVERSHRISGHWDQLADLPFTELATLAPPQLAQLATPLDPAAPVDLAWLAALPKLDLHCHLGGFATHGPALAAIRSAADVPAALLPPLDRPFPPSWPIPTTPVSLPAYMALGDNNGSTLLHDLGCLRAQCEALYAALVADHVLYAEIRCSPNNYAARDRSAWTVLTEIRSHFDRLMQASANACPDSTPACHVNLLVIATRKDGGDRSGISRHLALAITAADQWRSDSTCRVVGVDLAGFEHKETRAALFAADFDAVHRVGLAVTIHAGENDDAEGIWQAVFKLNARRLGHALHLQQSPDLLRAVAERRIGVEMCPAANLQIKGYPLDRAAADESAPAKAPAPPLVPDTDRYPLLTYLRGGVPVTVNTDNLGISAASLSENLALAARLCPGLTRLDILQLQRHALDSAFVSPSHRKALLTRFGDRLKP